MNLKRIRMDDPRRCQNCIYFHQHYVQFMQKYVTCDFGHCTRLLIKSVRTNNTCDSFEEKPIQNQT